jgi:hypothetical protein
LRSTRSRKKHSASTDAQPGNTRQGVHQASMHLFTRVFDLVVLTLDLVLRLNAAFEDLDASSSTMGSM